jgi:hypothetical protein
LATGRSRATTEKYGMDFRKAYWEERPDPSLVERHGRRSSRSCTAARSLRGYEDFLLYDFYNPQTAV